MRIAAVADRLLFGLVASLWLTAFSAATPRALLFEPFLVVLYGLAYAAAYRPWWALAYLPLLGLWAVAAPHAATALFAAYNVAAYLFGAVVTRGLRCRVVAAVAFWLSLQLASAAVTVPLVLLNLDLNPTYPYPHPFEIPIHAAEYAAAYALQRSILRQVDWLSAGEVMCIEHVETLWRRRLRGRPPS